MVEKCGFVKFFFRQNFLPYGTPDPFGRGAYNLQSISATRKKVVWFTRLALTRVKSIFYCKVLHYLLHHACNYNYVDKCFYTCSICMHRKYRQSSANFLICPIRLQSTNSNKRLVHAVLRITRDNFV